MYNIKLFVSVYNHDALTLSKLVSKNLRDVFHRYMPKLRVQVGVHSLGKSWKARTGLGAGSQGRLHLFIWELISYQGC